MEQKIKKCPRCAAEFPCGPASEKEPCWCAELPAIMPMSDAGCLCPKCLKEEISRRLADKPTDRAALKAGNPFSS